MQITLGKLFAFTAGVWFLCAASAALAIAGMRSLETTSATAGQATTPAGLISVTVPASDVHVAPTVVHVPAPIVEIRQAPAPEVVVNVPAQEPSPVTVQANVTVERVDVKAPLAVVADEFGRLIPPPK